MSQTVTVPGVGDLEFPDGMSQTDMAAAIQKNYPQIHQPTAAAPVKQEQESPYSAKNMLGAATEPLLTMATGALAAPVAGLAGLGTMAGNAMGLTNANPADVVRNVGGSMSYSPKTSGGQIALDTVTKPFQLLANGADAAGQKVSDVTGSPLAGAAVNTAIQSLPLLAGGRNYASIVTKGVAQRSAELSDLLARNKTKEATIAAVTDAGYKLTPGVVPDASAFMRSLQGLSGKAKTEQAATLLNQGVTNSLAHDYLGLTDKNAFSEDMINALHDKQNIPYETIAAMPETVIGQTSSRNPGTGNVITKDIVATGRQVLDDLKTARTDEKNAWADTKNPNLSQSESYQRAQAASAKADALESTLEQMATASGSPDLLNALKLARKEKAKIYTVDKALNDSTGDVNASVIKKQADKNNAIDGEAATIADMARAFPELSKVPSSGASLPLSPLDAYGSGMLSHIVGNGANLLGGLATAGLLPLSRVAARKYLMSDAGQAAMLMDRYQPYSPGTSGLFNVIAPSGFNTTVNQEQQ